MESERAAQVHPVPKDAIATDAPRPAAQPSDPTRSADPSSFPLRSEPVPSREAARVRDPARYEFLSEHGGGGLGRVSRVHDKDFGRDIAIKELLARSHVNELRFVRKAMITARLEHPGDVFAIGAMLTGSWSMAATGRMQPGSRS
jgi:serine/threonine protein kinase